ncbi:hypothetical protein EW026_g6867 [Hermanssonia centrifuga]|uniref:Cytochrome P450 n=1 Tax=Hermanssonia centrifuga TaxID=98765 RepID=A0A4S4K9U4_9APHY|nr:hypothetical protein EW026_g6867 [Hermanssonia centrifuga]
MRVNSMDDDYIHLARHSIEGFSQSRVPGAFWVESIPILKYIPSWVPGASATKFGARYKPFVDEMRDRPFRTVRDNSSYEGPTQPVAQKLIQTLEDNYAGTSAYAYQERIARDATGIAYAAAVDTVGSAFQLTTTPSDKTMQQKARQELDAVIGDTRLPEFEDFDALPYIQAIVLESLRWLPVLPLSIPHKVMVEDEYQGYRIPKGSTIVPNVWAMLHDPEEYPDPEAFNPDRFLKDGKINPKVRDPTMAFGFGRRFNLR